jgi:hypothetical protein
VGVRYRSGFSAGDLSGMPDSARTAVNDSVLYRRKVDRGTVRAKNDQSADSRAGHFYKWLLSHGYDDVSIPLITAASAVALLGAFVHTVALPGGTIQLAGICAPGTITGYVSAAHLWLEYVTGLTIPIHKPGTTNHIGAIGDIIALRRTWYQPRPKRQPIPYDIFRTLRDDAVATDRNGLPAVVFDWLRLGIFTGSRSAEYAQTSARRGCFDRVPDLPDAKEWAGTSLAFIAEDFELYDDLGFEVSHSEARACPSRVTFLHVRYRYDKSPRNFSHRKYKRVAEAGFLCPIRGALSILRRSHELCVPAEFPIGVFSPVRVPGRRRIKTAPGQVFTFLKSADLISVLQQACLVTYPDPRHELHKKVKQLVAHSNRVTAAVALHNAGQTDEAIAWRLRWKRESVEHYIRETHTRVGAITDLAVKGAFVM